MTTDDALARALVHVGWAHLYTPEHVRAFPGRFKAVLALADALEALAWYADRDNWRAAGIYRCGHSFPSPAEIDRGNKAGAVLAVNGD